MKSKRERQREILNKLCGYNPDADTSEDSDINQALSDLAALDPKDSIFIKHIQSHLKEGQEVICKICGKTAKEIINEEL